MAEDKEGLRLDDLTEIYRTEKKIGSLSTVRSDLYPAIAALLKKQREEYDRLLSDDPDSLWVDSANARRKKSISASKEIIEIRMRKICGMALRGAMGASNTFEALTPEEKEYYDGILAISKAHKGIVDRLSGKIRYVNTDITSIPPVPEPIPIPEAEEPVPKESVSAKAVETGMIPLETAPGMGEFDIDESDAEQDLPDDGFDGIEPIMDPAPEPAPEESELVLIRVLQDVETFAGLGNIDYTLRRENIVNLPKLFADILIKSGMAVKISVSP